ncbi:MAG: acyl carrier protein [Anaeromyxobacter sp.]
MKTTADRKGKSHMSLQQDIKQFIVDNFYVSNPAELADDTSLITGGYVDSTGMLEVIAHLEATYGIRVADQETVPENLETIGRIAAFVSRKQAAAA